MLPPGPLPYRPAALGGGRANRTPGWGGGKRFPGCRRGTGPGRCPIPGHSGGKGVGNRAVHHGFVALPRPFPNAAMGDDASGEAGELGTIGIVPPPGEEGDFLHLFQEHTQLGRGWGIVGRDQEEGAGARQFFVNPVEIPAPSAGGGGILPQVQDFTGGSQFPGQAGDVFAEPQGKCCRCPPCWRHRYRRPVSFLRQGLGPLLLLKAQKDRVAG